MTNDPFKMMGFGRPADADPNKDDTIRSNPKTEKKFDELNKTLRSKIEGLEGAS